MLFFQIMGGLVFFYQKIGPAAPQHFPYLLEQQMRKVAMGVDPALNLI
jgi:hypothetical protein